MKSPAWLLLTWLAACGSPPPAAYTRENDAAHAARRKGEHIQAAQHYERAATAAKNVRDAEEARYRAASSYARAGDDVRARALYRSLAQQGPHAERRARADFALADLQERAGDEAGADAQRVAAIGRHPNSGLARGALARHLAYLRKTVGSDGVLAYLSAASTALAHSELAETLAYRKARELDDAGRFAQARDAYLACAARFPYPGGAFWDDALYRAAEKELALSAPERAIFHLRRLLAAREEATIVGSYERGRYAEAQLKLGHIFRDRLHDPARARQELRKVWHNHARSVLADDALFDEALLARAAGDAAGTCAPLAIIATHLPESRFAPCAHLLCDTLAKPARECHDYIKRAAGLP